VGWPKIKVTASSHNPPNASGEFSGRTGHTVLSAIHMKETTNNFHVGMCGKKEHNEL